MSKFSTVLETIPHRGRGPACPVAVVLAQLDKASRADVLAALVEGSGWQSTQIAKALKDMQHPIAAEKVQKHRRGDCRCAA